MPTAGTFVDETLVPIHTDNNDNTIVQLEHKSTNILVPISDDLPFVQSSNAAAAATTTTTPVPIIVPEVFYPIKSCLSNKSLFNGDDDDDYDDNGNNTTTSKIKKSVSFHKIEIREHERTISDHPSVSSGVGLGIGWESIDSLQCSVDEWEIYRPPRRTKSNLIIPSYLREQILRNECDISQLQINDSLKQISRIKNSRNQASRDPVVVVDSTHKSSPIRNGTTGTTNNTTTIVTEEESSSTVPTIRRRRSFMGLSRLLRPSKYNNNNGDNHFHSANNNSALVDIEVEQLMERSIRAEQIRQQQRLAYIATLQKEQARLDTEVKEQDQNDDRLQQQQEEEVQEPLNDSATTPSIMISESPICDDDDDDDDDTNTPTKNNSASTNECSTERTCNPTLPTITTSSSNSLSSPSPFGTAEHHHHHKDDHHRKSTEETEEEAWEF